MNDYCASCYKSGEQLCKQQSCNKYCLICIESMFSQAINIVRCQSCHMIIPIWTAYIKCSDNIYNRYLTIAITSIRTTMTDYVNLGEVDDIISIISEYKCIVDSIIRLKTTSLYCNRSHDILTLCNRANVIHAEGSNMCNIDELLTMDHKTLYDKLIDMSEVYTEEPLVVNTLTQYMRGMVSLMLNEYTIGGVPEDFSYIIKYINAITVPRLDVCSSVDAALLLYPESYNRSPMLLLRIEEILCPVGSIYGEMKTNISNTSLYSYRMFLTNIVNAIDEL